MFTKVHANCNEPKSLSCLPIKVSWNSDFKLHISIYRLCVRLKTPEKFAWTYINNEMFTMLAAPKSRISLQLCTIFLKPALKFREFSTHLEQTLSSSKVTKWHFIIYVEHNLAVFEWINFTILCFWFLSDGNCFLWRNFSELAFECWLQNHGMLSRLIGIG